MEKNKSFSWINAIVMVVMTIIVVLCVGWIVSSNNSGLSDKLDVLTNDIFSKNMNSMKEVGKEYFTIERLPEKIGEVETLTLKEMYEQNLILELTDKDGNACSADNSYVSIEKYDNEYQMKVYLECGEEDDFIVVIMGCYDYCDKDICEPNVNKVENVSGGKGNSTIEYEYQKVTGGYWSDWGAWSDWSKTSITGTNYREVETKKETEEYIYDKTITDTLYIEFDASCPNGYTKTSDGTSCYKLEDKISYSDPVCPSVSGYENTDREGFTCSYSKTTTTNVDPTCPVLSGYTNTGRNGFECTYSKTTITTKEPTCPSVSGYTNTGRNGFECTYSKTATSTADPVCPSKSGYTNTGREGFTCSYSKTVTSTADPVCPSKSGYTNTGRNGFECSYSKTVTSSEYTLSYSHTSTSSYVPADTDEYDYVLVSSDYVYDCNNSCAFRWVYTYKVYKKVYGTTTETTTATATCPSGYSNVNGTCSKSTTSIDTATATCPSGYSNVNGTCSKSTTSIKTKTATCPSGYSSVNGMCSKSTTSAKTEIATCPSGYDSIKGTCSKSVTDIKTADAICETGYSKTSDGNRCSKTETIYVYNNLVKSCPLEYSKTSDGSKCYKKVLTTQTVSQVREVTYYRYRLREYLNGTVDYKWSSSNNDSKLLNNGYVLTGRTR